MYEYPKNVIKFRNKACSESFFPLNLFTLPLCMLDQDHIMCELQDLTLDKKYNERNALNKNHRLNY